jgi:hypothetical protein
MAATAASAPAISPRRWTPPRRDRGVASTSGRASSSRLARAASAASSSSSSSGDGDDNASDRGDVSRDRDDAVSVPPTQHVVCVSFDAAVDATDEMCVVGFEAARRFWPGKIPGSCEDYADVFRMLTPCLDESSSFEGALMVRVMAEENLAERTRFRLELKRRKAARLKREAAERAAMAKAVTAKQRAAMETESAARRDATKATREREYAARAAELNEGRTTRPLNLREVVAAWDEIKLHASMKFGCDLETAITWEGLTVAPRGLQAVVNQVRDEFHAGTIVLSRDDTCDGDDDDEEDDDDDDACAAGDAGDGASPREIWLRSHALHHGVREFFDACARDGHAVIVLGGPWRRASMCADVLEHLGVAVERSDDDGGGGGGVPVIGSERGSARGLAVAAAMSEREMPWQRWHLVDGNLSELARVARSAECASFTSQYASWVPCLYGDRVRAEMRDGVRVVDHAGMFALVDAEAPAEVMDRVTGGE